MEEGKPLGNGSYTWKIKGFTQLTEAKYNSETFIVAGCKWCVAIYPRGNKMNSCCSVYLEVAESESLPRGWSIEAEVSLTMVNQSLRNYSTTRVTPKNTFTVKEKDWGLRAFKNLVELHDHTRGFLVHNTVVVEAQVVIYKVVPPITNAQQSISNQCVTAQRTADASQFNTYFTGLESFVSAAELTSSASNNQSANTACHDKPPSLEEVEKAKQFLRECVCDQFHLNMKEKLWTALLILSRAKTGLSPDQLGSIESLLANFSDFISGFLTFEVDSSAYELQKAVKARLLSNMKNSHETHISYTKLFDGLAEEEKELLEKLEQLKVKKAKLVLDWESLVAESEETKSRYKDQEKLLAEAETKKRRAEEGKAVSEAAWSGMKVLFA